MRSASGGPRVLLRRLRETMAEQVSAQERLDKIVVLIAANMVAEVCSTYVLRVDNTLELYATEGLNRDAVHRTVLSAHEGLVGLVASEATPLNLSDAQSHPAFSYRPETGEEIYHSFLGVPILRAGNTLGVLVVQNRAKRTYVEEEVEALQTTAMVLAEMIASGELSALAQPGAEPAARHSLHKSGAVLSDGIALGHVVLHEPRVVITNYIAEDLPKEIKRLELALTKLRADLDRMLERGDVADGGEHRDVLEAYRMFANDHGWSHKLHEAVGTGLTAEAAVERVQSDTRARMLRSTDPYLRDRLHDLEDLGHRLMRQLVGRDHAPSREQLPDNAILIARAMGPAALLDYDRKRLRGLVLEEGTANSHVSIVARALGIPAVGGVPNAPGIADPGDAIIVDGISGEIYVRPSAEIEIRLCRAGPVPRPAAGAIFSAARQALHDQGRPAGRTDDQCRPHHRPAAYRRDRQRRHRPVSDRAAVHGEPQPAAQQRSARALSHGAGCRGHQTRHLPHPRYRRRPGAALHGNGGRGNPALTVARSAGLDSSRFAGAARSRAAAGRRRSCAKIMLPTISDAPSSIRPRRLSSANSTCCHSTAIAAGACRRRYHGRGAGAALHQALDVGEGLRVQAENEVAQRSPAQRRRGVRRVVAIVEPSRPREPATASTSGRSGGQPAIRCGPVVPSRAKCSNAPNEDCVVRLSRIVVVPVLQPGLAARNGMLGQVGDAPGSASGPWRW